MQGKQNTLSNIIQCYILTLYINKIPNIYVVLYYLLSYSLLFLPKNDFICVLWTDSQPHTALNVQHHFFG